MGAYIPDDNSFCELLGVNAYHDWRQGFISDYHQMGVGVEVLSRRWDFRANAYIPFGAAKNLNVCNYNYPGGYEMTFSDCEFATYGFNAEVGCEWEGFSSLYGNRPLLLNAVELLL